VAAGFLPPSNVSFSLRNILASHANIEVKMAEIVSVDLSTRPFSQLMVGRIRATI